MLHDPFGKNNNKHDRERPVLRFVSLSFFLHKPVVWKPARKAGNRKTAGAREAVTRYEGQNNVYGRSDAPVHQFHDHTITA